jgi:hypothetical protein
MTSDGSVSVGNDGSGQPIFQWTAQNGVQLPTWSSFSASLAALSRWELLICLFARSCCL